MATTHKQLFALDTANRMLALIRPIALDIISEWDSYLKGQAEILTLQGKSERDPEAQARLRKLRADCQDSEERVDEYVQELSNLGVSFHEFGGRRVHFPARINRKEVVLCWRTDESSVHAWHHLDEPCDQSRPCPA